MIPVPPSTRKGKTPKSTYPTHPIPWHSEGSPATGVPSPLHLVRPQVCPPHRKNNPFLACIRRMVLCSLPPFEGGYDIILSCPPGTGRAVRTTVSRDQESPPQEPLAGCHETWATFPLVKPHSLPDRPRHNEKPRHKAGVRGVPLVWRISVWRTGSDGGRRAGRASCVPSCEGLG